MKKKSNLTSISRATTLGLIALFGLSGCAAFSPGYPPPGCSASGSLELGTGGFKIENEKSCDAVPESESVTLLNRVGKFLLALSNFSIADIDFSEYEIEISTSNAIVTNSPGEIHVKLYDGDNVIASRYFDYTMSYNKLKLADPSAVKSWALTYEGFATRFDMSIRDIEGTPGAGEGSVSLRSKYKGSTISTQTSHFNNTNPNCSQPSPYECDVTSI